MTGSQTAHDPAHWDAAFRRGDAATSWFEPVPTMSLRMLEHAGRAARHSVIDVGGGTSRLVDSLVELGHTDLTVLDLSPGALAEARARLGPRSASVHWVAADVTRWRPRRRFDIWHDRAVLHFLTSLDDQRRYLRVLHAATVAGSHAVIATFGPDGPCRCSGLQVTRYDPDGLAALLGDRWRLVHSEDQDHVTPAGATQRFTWTAFRRTEGSGPAVSDRAAR